VTPSTVNAPGAARSRARQLPEHATARSPLTRQTTNNGPTPSGQGKVSPRQHGETNESPRPGRPRSQPPRPPSSAPVRSPARTGRDPHATRSSVAPARESARGTTGQPAAASPHPPATPPTTRCCNDHLNPPRHVPMLRCHDDRFHPFLFALNPGKHQTGELLLRTSSTSWEKK
jgi:hypothetical protein